jgi:hypothetical protein
MKKTTLANAVVGVKRTSFSMEDVKATLRKLKPFIGQNADNLWARYNTGDKMEKQEWIQIINLLAQKYRINGIEENVALPPPGDNQSTGEIPIGNIVYLNQPPREFRLSFPELTRHMGIFGSTGTGKTTLAKNILRELAKCNIPFIVFDWERNYRDLIRENKGIKIFTIGSGISPFYFNFFKMPEGIPYKEYVKNLVEIFNKAYVGGAGSDSVLLKVFDRAYMEKELPTADDARKILFEDMRGKLRGREMLWKQSSMRMLQFLCYGGTGKVYNSSGFPMEKLLNESIIFELGGLANSNDKRFFVEMFTLWYWLYKEQQGFEDEKLKHVLVFEEFHNIVENSKKDDLIQKIFRQIRKYGTSLVVLDQTPSLIPNPVFENLYTKITFSLNHWKNVSAIADAMFMTQEERKYIGMLTTGQVICRLMGRYNYPFQLSISFKKPGVNIPDLEIREHMKSSYKDYTAEKARMPEREPLQIPTEQFTPSPLERIFLDDLLKNPFDGADQRGKRLGLIPRDSSKIQNNLIAHGVITPVIVDKKKLFELTDAGKDCVQRVGFKILYQDKSQGLEHRYFTEKIKEALISRGWTPYKEKSDIDLVIEKEDKTIVIEIETGKNKKDQIKKNIKKLQNYQAAQRLVLATNDPAFVTITNLFSELSAPERESIQIIHIREFLKALPA